MEWPECPVCLQTYDASATVPRVLACGHSACEQCIASLPPPPPPTLTADALRCPSCTQLVPFPRSLGPSALPKNIDLLRLIPSSSGSVVDPKPKPSPSEVVSIPWNRRALLSEWKDSILPQGSLRIVGGNDKYGVLVGVVASALGRPWFLRENERVSLLSIGGGCSCSSVDSEWFRLSYVAQVVEVLGELGNVVRDEVKVIIDAGMRERRGLCRVYGLWMDFEGRKSDLFLVCQLFDESSYNEIFKERIIFGAALHDDDNNGVDHLQRFCAVSLELCEAVMGLHSLGIACGFLTDYCFCFDKFGHCLLDLSKVLAAARMVWQSVNYEGTQVIPRVSPELFAAVNDENGTKDLGFEGLVGYGSDMDLGIEGLVGYGSDIWSLGCILATVLLGADASILVELEETYHLIQKGTRNIFVESYNIWKEKMINQLKDILKGVKFEPLLNILELCLCYDSNSRPEAYEIWHCFHALLGKAVVVDFNTIDFTAAKDNSVCCLAIGSLCSLPKGAEDVPRGEVKDVDVKNSTNANISETNGVEAYDLDPKKDEQELGKQLVGDASKPITLHDHHDCITALTVKGGFLFSSSFDKTISVWSLQDFSHVQHLKGHKHRVMAMTVMDSPNELLCISGDSGSGIFIWSIGQSVSQEPQRNWYEHNDWRYSGIHSLAISGTGYLYSGSGDKSIKAWSLQDYSLACTMTGHNSTVSSLAVAGGILYSGSWDGTIRLWWLHDHSALAVLENDTPQTSTPVLSLSAEGDLLVSSYENGFLRIWRNSVLVRSEKVHDGSIFAVYMDKHVLFSGGWDKTINIKELPENELEADMGSIASIKCDAVITCLLYWSGKLFVGLSNKEIKVYPFESW